MDTLPSLCDSSPRSAAGNALTLDRPDRENRGPSDVFRAFRGALPHHERISLRSESVVSDGKVGQLPAAAPAAPAREVSRLPTIDSAEAVRSLAEARRLYRIAQLVHSHRVVGGVESAVFAQKSLGVLLKLLVRLHGDPVPDSFKELVERGRAIARSEDLLAEDLSPELAVIDEMRANFVELGGETTPADDRRYDRAFVKSAEWLEAVEDYLNQRLPVPKAPSTSKWIAAVLVLLAFVAGVFVGRKGTPPAPTAAVVGAPAGVAPAAAQDLGPALTATFFRDTELKEAVLKRRDTTISFDWETAPPAESLPMDNFSVRWEGNLYIPANGKYTFFLTSDDGSRLFIDNALVIDNWGSHASLLKTGELELNQGSHAIRVEYFDEVGIAVIKLEWGSDQFAQRLIGQADLR